MTERRLLLINPAHMVAGCRRGGPMQFPIPPLSLGYVAACTPANWAIRIIDENLRSAEGLDWRPDLVGITTLTPTAPRAYELAARYRAQGAKVVLGGVHPTALPDEAARYADCVVVGEAEPVWRQVIDDFEAGCLKARYQGQFLPLDGLPTPRRDLYPGLYFAQTIITSRGCTNACEFCSIWRFYGRRYRARPIDEVVDELESLPASRIVFISDDNLTLNRPRTIALCQRMVERGVRLRYAVEGTLGLAEDDELLTWLKRSGCVFVFVGLETLRAEMLAHIGKPDLLRLGANRYQEQIARIHAHGMAVFGSFIVGLDGDTADVFEPIRSFCLAADVDCTLVNVLCPTPDTLLWERLERDNRLLYTNFPADYALYTQD
ncbi:MAG: B12-binding domain-containing radical SAM protein, partial [Anaerolineales bacterium]|nr:B12-binding domain-containing radical SAM protein [Anaerolineales bacterium]